MNRVEVEIEAAGWRETLPGIVALAERAAAAALGTRASAEGADCPLGGPAGSSEVCILLADDETVKDLNARFRGRDRATNVLSFPAASSAAPHLGDLVLALGICRAESEAQAKRFDHHVGHLIVHGVLHLLGHDHEREPEAEAMETLERDVLAGLGIPDPYEEREPHGER